MIIIAKEAIIAVILIELIAMSNSEIIVAIVRALMLRILLGNHCGHRFRVWVYVGIILGSYEL